MKVSEVFIAGGQPTITYIPRVGAHLQSELDDYLDARHKLLAVAGPTKSGKTVLVRKRLSRDQAVWIPGGEAVSLDRFWELVVDQLDAFTSVSTSSASKATQTDASVRDLAIKPSGIGLGTGSTKTKQTESGTTTTETRAYSPSAIGPDILRSALLPLVIDDFHYIERTVQTSIVRALKDPIFEGLPVVCISTSHRGFDAVRAEPEMVGRVRQLSIPAWKPDELAEIGTTGFNALNLDVDPSTLVILREETFGSPHLMQEFCGAYCRERGIREAPPSRVKLDPVREPEKFFARHSDDGAIKAIERLARGPNARSDRIDRRTKSGKTVDIYQAVLMALAKTGPQLETEYDVLRAALKDVLDDDLPQAHEVTRVIQNMTKIAKEELRGEPPIDWDERTLHITDPFFAYALRWSPKFQ